MQKSRQAGAPWGLRAFILLAFAVAIAVLFTQSVAVRREYDALSKVTPAPTQAPPQLAYREKAPEYREGSIGPEVIALQQRLFALGYYTKEIDGKYYEGTIAAVKAFQAQHGLAADGIAGTLTLAVLNGPDARPFDPAFQTPSPPPAP